ncbi:MAG: N-acetyltransferase family protein [Alphaproteobacteria bacterium]
MSDLFIRPALQSDVPAITRIYGHHAVHGFGTFDEEVPPDAQFRDRLAELDAAGHPFLAACLNDELLGFAYAAPFRPRTGWRFSFEDSIYMAPGELRRGYGTKLLTALVAKCREIGVRNLIAVVGDSQNLPSIRVHERCGFAQIGTLRDVGFKKGRWLDVVFLQAKLA